MENYILPYFGELDINSLEDYYDTEVTVNNRQIEVDLNFEETAIESEKLDKIKIALENIESLDKNNRIYISENSKNSSEGSFVNDYLNYHLEELAEYLEIDSKKSDLENLETLQQNLYVRRIGFYPNDNKNFITFDYCLNYDVSDELLVIVTDIQNNLTYITWES